MVSQLGFDNPLCYHNFCPKCYGNITLYVLWFKTKDRSMDRAQRKSERLIEKRRRAGRRSHEISVGESLDADTHEVDATNLAEARAMDSARKAAARREKQTPRVKNKHGKKKHSRGNKSKTKKQSSTQNKSPRHERERSRRELKEGLKTDPRTNRRRSFIDEADGLAVTE